MAYLSGISSVSNSSFTSFGSNDTVLTEPLQINSSVFLNNNIAYGSRWGYSVLGLCEDFFFVFIKVIKTVN